jgi:glucosamine--fructose-6-phosphate aminotransferase (isomerizing)
MCGIVGILGTKPVAENLVDALRRLEYRGYDSAGIATLENGRLAPRAPGKLRISKTAARPAAGLAGIGHALGHASPNEPRPPACGGDV